MIFNDIDEFIKEVKRIGKENCISFNFDITESKGRWNKPYLLECYLGTGASDNVAIIEAELEDIMKIVKELVEELYPRN